MTAVNRSELAEAVSHFDVAMALAGEWDPIAQIELFGHDARVTCRGFAAWAFWMLGGFGALGNCQLKPSRLQRKRTIRTRSRSLFFAAFVCVLRREAQPGAGERTAAQACVDEAIATARRTGEVYYLPELLD